MKFDSPRDLLGKEGLHLGKTGWLQIDQERIDGFAKVTEDHQWIHVDPERSKTGPFGATIAHGYLTASLAAWFLPQLLEMSGFSMGVNVGLDRLRFIAPVRVGSKLRASGEVIKVEEIKGAIQSVVRLTVEIEGEDKPACIMDTVSRYYME
ncbi:MAG: MaoC family dehydratase [Hyphomonadaceae bacterium]|nr:MaoC family dehydratase [Hyphomonadaceae bacterium]